MICTYLFETGTVFKICCSGIDFKLVNNLYNLCNRTCTYVWTDVWPCIISMLNSIFWNHYFVLAISLVYILIFFICTLCIASRDIRRDKEKIKIQESNQCCVRLDHEKKCNRRMTNYSNPSVQRRETAPSLNRQHNYKQR